MTATNPTLPRHNQPIRRLLNVFFLALTLVLTACGESLTGAEMDDESFNTVYDLNLTTRYIEVVGSCDVDIRGIYANGEFQYRYALRGEGQTFSRESDNYDSRLGETFSRQPEETINFSNKTYTWRTLSPSASIEVEVSGVEWDGLVRDSRMKNRSASQKVPFALGKRTRAVGVGAATDCRIVLYYDAEWTERLVSN